MQYTARLKQVVKEVNHDCDVRGLCLEFPQRLADLKDRSGDRLPK